MALNSAQSKAIAFIDEIYTLSKSNRFSSMITKINNLSIFIYDNVSIIYSNINRYFYKIGLVPILVNYCIYVPHESGKDILRLLHIFIKTNKNIKYDVANSNNFMKHLSTVLSIEDTWKNTANFKYHIHIAAYLLMDSEPPKDFSVFSILKIIREKIEENTYPENILMYIVCYACFMPISNFESVTNTSKEASLGRFFSKPTVKKFITIMENYLYEFKSFYNNSENRTNQYSLFQFESEFTFDQICHSLHYYSRQSEQICMNISDNGIYNLISEILQIKYIPEHFISKSLDILSIPSFHSKAGEKFKHENCQLFDSLNSYLVSDSFSQTNKNKAKLLINKYWSSESHSINNCVNISIDERQTLLSIQSNISLESKSLQTIDFGKSFNVNDWLIENQLNYLQSPFSHLTGKGLYQMKVLLNCSGGRVKLIHLLTSKMDINMVWVLEFLACLDNLSFI